jgi:hypothetical protein
MDNNGFIIAETLRKQRRPLVDMRCIPVAEAKILRHSHIGWFLLLSHSTLLADGRLAAG